MASVPHMLGDIDLSMIAAHGVGSASTPLIETRAHGRAARGIASETLRISDGATKSGRGSRYVALCPGRRRTPVDVFVISGFCPYASLAEKVYASKSSVRTLISGCLTGGCT